MFTPEVVDLYIQDDGRHCPYCKSEYMEERDFHMDRGGGFLILACGQCKKDWFEILKIVGIQEPDEE